MSQHDTPWIRCKMNRHEQCRCQSSAMGDRAGVEASLQRWRSVWVLRTVGVGVVLCLMGLVAACTHRSEQVPVAIYGVAPLHVQQVTPVHCSRAAEVWSELYRIGGARSPSPRWIPNPEPPFVWPAGRYRTTIVLDRTSGVVTETLYADAEADMPVYVTTITAGAASNSVVDTREGREPRVWCIENTFGSVASAAVVQQVESEDRVTTWFAQSASPGSDDRCPPLLAPPDGAGPPGNVRATTLDFRNGCVAVESEGPVSWSGEVCVGDDGLVSASLMQTDGIGSAQGFGDVTSFELDVNEWQTADGTYSGRLIQTADQRGVTVRATQVLEGDRTTETVWTYELGTAGVPVELNVSSDQGTLTRMRWEYLCE